MKSKQLKVNYVPNCARCKWAHTSPAGLFMNCKAMGGIRAHKVYDGAKCRKLYEPKGDQ